MKLKTLTLRFNREVAPFQHVRIELSYSLDKGEPDLSPEIRQAIADDAHTVLADIQRVCYPEPPPPPDLNSTQDRL